MESFDFSGGDGTLFEEMNAALDLDDLTHLNEASLDAMARLSVPTNPESMILCL